MMLPDVERWNAREPGPSARDLPIVETYYVSGGGLAGNFVGRLDCFPDVIGENDL